MMNTLRSFTKQCGKKVARAESGYTVTIQAIYYTVLLFIFFALIYDFGNVGYIATVATNASRLAAQDAAKNIDQQAFIEDQEVILSSDATDRAQQLVSSATEGKVQVTQVTLLEGGRYIAVYASATAQMPVLGSLFGLWSVTFPVQAFAEPAYGIGNYGD